VIRFLLDTNVVAEGARPRPEPAVRDRLARHAHESAISATTWHELVFGVERLPRGRRRDALDEYLRSVAAGLPVLPYDQRAADWHGRQRAAEEASGRPSPFADRQIAAVAVTNGLTLVSRNLRDFAGLPGLAVESWWPSGS
jgi:tRNA(fMet)-specific endonuclease VapC